MNQLVTLDRRAGLASLRSLPASIRQSSSHFLLALVRQLHIHRDNRLQSFLFAFRGANGTRAFAMGEPFVRTKVALIVHPATNLTFDDSCHCRYPLFALELRLPNRNDVRNGQSTRLSLPVCSSIVASRSGLLHSICQNALIVRYCEKAATLAKQGRRRTVLLREH